MDASVNTHTPPVPAPGGTARRLSPVAIVAAAIGAVVAIVPLAVAIGLPAAAEQAATTSSRMHVVDPH